MSPEDAQDIGEALRRRYGIDGTAGDAQDVEHPYIAVEPHEYCALCGLAPVTSKHIALPADMLAASVVAPEEQSDLRMFPWLCLMCVGGLVLGLDGQAVERCLHCAGTGLTNDPCGPAELAPRPPGVMRTACADCALRPGSPELEAAGVALPYEEPFFCHQGVHVSAAGRYEPVATFRGLPLGLMVCAGWWALKTGQSMPAKPYREIPITEDDVVKRWGPKLEGEPT